MTNTFTKEEITSIKTSANRFDVNIIIPNSDKNYKSIAYLNTIDGIEDLYNISKAEKWCSDNSWEANKKGVMTKSGAIYRKNLAQFDLAYLALNEGGERPNRTYQNAIRRLSDNPNYSKDKAIEMLSSEFGLKNCQKFIHPNTLITKLDLYLNEGVTSTKTEKVINETETESTIDTETLIGFDVAYDTIAKLLNKKNVTLDNVQSIHDLCNDIIKQKQNTMKLANVG